MNSWVRLLTIVLSGSICVFVFNTSTDKNERMEMNGNGLLQKGVMGIHSHHGFSFSPDTNQFSIPGFPDSLKNSNSFSDTKSEGLNLFKMPVFIPDSTVTESMPILIPPPVDEGMIIPLN